MQVRFLQQSLGLNVDGASRGLQYPECHQPSHHRYIYISLFKDMQMTYFLDEARPTASALRGGIFPEPGAAEVRTSRNNRKGGKNTLRSSDFGIWGAFFGLGGGCASVLRRPAAALMNGIMGGEGGSIQSEGAFAGPADRRVT